MSAAAARAGRYGRAGLRWARLLADLRPRPGLRVSYGWDRVPAPGEPASGGTAKLQKLAERWPNRPADFTLLYLASPHFPRDLGPLLRIARRRRAAVVVNQDGVAYPGWAGDRVEELNRPLRRAIATADHVLYQSAFCKRSADAFVGGPRGSWEILHNAVDVGRFTPGLPPEGPPVLLLGGDQTQAYRLELALATLRALQAAHPDARLLVTGRTVVDADRLASELGLRAHVDLIGHYAQRDAPDVFRRAHLLLHTKVNDPCPTTVIEAMACGLPVVYPASGGTVELVGDEAGIGVPHEDAFERDSPPEAEALAEAVTAVLADRARFAAAARDRAVGRFALGPWLDRHAELFAELTRP
ncbi:MAG: glycosyltransferase family 4 protein [Pseudomonadota bacterium]